MNSKFDIFKNKFLQLLPDLIENSQNSSLADSIESWKEITNNSFFEYYHKADKTKIFSYLSDDDPDEHNPAEIDFYDSVYIDKTRKELSYEGIGTNRYFIIAGVDGADEMAFLSSNFSKGVAILHHDHVFCSDNLNAKLDQAAEELSLVKFIESLEYRSNS